MSSEEGNQEIETHGTECHVKTETDGNDDSISQGTPRIARNHLKLGECCATNSSLEPQREPDPTITLISDFWSPEVVVSQLISGTLLLQPWKQRAFLLEPQTSLSSANHENPGFPSEARTYIQTDTQSPNLSAMTIFLALREGP